MAYKKAGYYGWIQYDDVTDTIKYGDWTFNPEYLGLKREKTAYDPKSFKSIDDVFKALGADQRAIDSTKNGFGWGMLGMGRDIFTGQDKWKNQVAYDIWNMANPNKKVTYQSSQSNMGWFGMTEPEKFTNKVYKGDDGLIYLNRMENIPTDKAFAQMAYDKSWELYNQGVDRRHGNSPYANQDKMHGKAVKTSLLA